MRDNTLDPVRPLSTVNLKITIEHKIRNNQLNKYVQICFRKLHFTIHTQRGVNC